MSDTPENGGENADIPIVVTGGSVMLGYTEDQFEDDGHGGGRRKLMSRNRNKKIRFVIIKDESGREVYRYTAPANGRCSVEFHCS